MARKNKRSQVRKPQRGQAGSARAARPAGLPPTPATAATGEAAAQPAPTSPTAPRMVQRPLPRSRGRQQAGPLPPEDATIPLDRVPYFLSDVRRIAITAAFMIVLLIAGSVVLRAMLQA
jgi:hypothetical protein